MKRAVIALFLACILLSSCSASPEKKEGITVACMDFPSYDFARAVCGEMADVVMVIPPYADLHSHTLTLSEVVKLQSCDLLVFNGGEGMGEIERAVEASPNEIKMLPLISCVNLLEEELTEGMAADEEEGEDEEYDVHVCVSIANASAICEKIRDEMCIIDPGNAEIYTQNCASYTLRLAGLKGEFEEFFSGLKHRVLVVGDVFPFRYFAEEFGLECYAAFPGCAEGDVAPSLTSLAVLTEKIRQYDLKAVLYVEFSSKLTANCIATETGVETRLLRSCYAVEKERFDEGVTYIDLMKENLQTLREVMG